MLRITRSKITATLSELARDPVAAVAAGNGSPVAILDGDKTAFYCVPVKVFERMIERLEDFELNCIADARKGEAAVKVSLDEL